MNLKNLFIMFSLTALIFSGSGLFAQVERWVYRYNGPADGLDAAHSIIYGPDGNIYVTGISCISGTFWDYDLVVVKIDTLGRLCWLYSYDGPGESWDEGYSIVYGGDNNLYIAGRSGTVIQRQYDYDFIVISLDTAGNERWIYRHDGTGPESEYEEAKSITYGADGNIYAAGTIADGITNRDFTVISFSSSGSINWTYKYNGPGNSNDVATSIIYSHDGNLYVAGYSVGVYSQEDFTIISLNTDGNPRWVWRQGDPFFDILTAIIYGEDGNLYTCGFSGDPYGGLRAFKVISVTSDGTLRWLYGYVHPPSLYDQANSIVCGEDGNIYATGLSYTGNSMALTVISLNRSGSPRWVYVSPTPGNNYGRSIIYGANDNLYIAGRIADYFAVVSLDTLGNERWVYTYNNPHASLDYSCSIVYGLDGYIYSAGFCDNANGQGDLAVVSLVDTPTIGITENQKLAVKSKKDVELEVYPNPFRNTVSIKLQTIPKSEISSEVVSIKIFDVSGRLVKLFNHITIRSFNQIIWDGTDDSGSELPAGVYFVVLEHSGLTPLKVVRMK